MIYKLQIIYLALIPSLSQADELYNFVKITCAKEMKMFQAEQISVWNVNNAVWGSNPNDWDKHIILLKKLEEKYGFYVFNELYGYYPETDEEITCDLGEGGLIKIKSKQRLRPKGPVGSEKPVRSGPIIEIVSPKKGLLVSAPLLVFNKIQFSSNTVLDYCFSKNIQCKQWMFIKAENLPLGINELKEKP